MSSISSIIAFISQNTTFMNSFGESDYQLELCALYLCIMFFQYSLLMSKLNCIWNLHLCLRARKSLGGYGHENRQSEAKYKRSDSIQFVFLFHFQFRNLIMWTMFTFFGNMWTWKEFKKDQFNRYFFLKNWFQCIKQARLLDYQILL